MVWVVFALFLGAAILAVLWPLSRDPAPTPARDHDVAFYHAQTAEIARDAERGVIGPDEAETARVEAARRLVSAGARNGTEVGPGSRWTVRLVALGAIVFVPVLTLGLYTRIGAPGLPDEPLSARLTADPAHMDIAAMIARVESAVAKHPDDGRGWTLLAGIYTQLGRAPDAVRATTNEIRVLGPSEARLSALGELETIANGGVVGADAKANFTQAAVLDPASPRARFYLGVAAEQGGDKTAALSIWKGLVAEAPAGAPWLPLVQGRIAAANGEPAAPAGAASGPTPEAAAAVAALPANEQQAMIHRMVDGLATRLKADGGDLAGWLRLVRAYGVLHEADKAKAALADARRNFAANAEATKRLDTLAQELGLENS